MERKASGAFGVMAIHVRDADDRRAGDGCNHCIHSKPSLLWSWKDCLMAFVERKRGGVDELMNWETLK